MKLHITRDSVAAGDDVDAPHDREMDLPEGCTVEQAVTLIFEADYLANIVGGKATWSIVSNRPIAVGAQQWENPKMLSAFPYEFGELNVENGVLHIHITYHAQQDPDVVFEVLRHLRYGF